MKVLYCVVGLQSPLYGNVSVCVNVVAIFSMVYMLPDKQDTFYQIYFSFYLLRYIVCCIVSH